MPGKMQGQGAGRGMQEPRAAGGEAKEGPKAHSRMGMGDRSPPVYYFVIKLKYFKDMPEK